MQSVERLWARTEVYKFLSHAYRHPEDILLKSDSLGRLKNAFHTLGLELAASELASMVAYLHARQEPLELAVEYTRLFRGPVKAEAYPYESMYVDGEIMGQSSLDVVRRYREAGVAVSEGFKDLPDHICVELEFMHYLCAREFDALESGAQDEVARIQVIGQSFLKDHLVRWVFRFTDRILQYASTPFYVSLAKITREFTRCEASACGEASRTGTEEPKCYP